MRRRAVDKGGTGGAQGPLVPDRGARAVIVTAGQRAVDVSLVASRDAQPDHIDQQVLAFTRRRGGDDAGFERDDPVGQDLSNRNLWQSRRHRRQTRNILV